EVEPYLAYGREIVGFDSTADLLRQVRYYLAHPEEAEAVRRAGRARVLAEHTWPAVWPRLLDQLHRLGEREGVWPRFLHRLGERLGEAFR
ncbi:MAG TPA: glycosyltransferase, partial [Thermoanaerobaculia bacterium]